MGLGYRKAAAAGFVMLGASVAPFTAGVAHAATADEGRICNAGQNSAGTLVESALGRVVKRGGTVDCPPPSAPAVETPAQQPKIIASISSDVLFDFDKSVLKPEAYSELERVVNILKESPETRFEVVGHADSTGTTEYN